MLLRMVFPQLTVSTQPSLILLLTLHSQGWYSQAKKSCPVLIFYLSNANGQNFLDIQLFSRVLDMYPGYGLKKSVLSTREKWYMSVFHFGNLTYKRFCQLFQRLLTTIFLCIYRIDKERFPDLEENIKNENYVMQ